MGAAHIDALRPVLERARSLGFLGPMSIDAQLAHAAGFVEVITREPCATIVDLGSGGGMPALAVAMDLPDTEMALVERGTRRAGFLGRAVETLGLENRVEVVHGEAQIVARHPRWAGWADVVTARSFGPPLVTAECGCRFLRPGGRMIVSEPPPERSDPGARWPLTELAPTGLVPEARDLLVAGTFQTLRLAAPIDERIPRRRY